MFALVLTGPPGSGKTAILTALHDSLADDGIRHAVVEVEALAWTHPALSDEQSFRHLVTIRQMYDDSGYDLLLCGATVTSPAYMRDLLVALAADDVLIVRLEAPVETLRERIIDREPPGWSGLPHLLRAVDEIASVNRLLEGMAVFTDGADPDQVSAEIRSARPEVLMTDIANPS